MTLPNFLVDSFIRFSLVFLSCSLDSFLRRQRPWTMADSVPIDPVDPRGSLPRQNPQSNDTSSDKTVEIEQAPSTLPKLDDPPPDGGYGWVCVACNFFINGKKHIPHWSNKLCVFCPVDLRPSRIEIQPGVADARAASDIAIRLSTQSLSRPLSFRNHLD